jgi:hypothetical protein
VANINLIWGKLGIFVEEKDAHKYTEIDGKIAKGIAE